MNETTNTTLSEQFKNTTLSEQFKNTTLSEQYKNNKYHTVGTVQKQQIPHCRNSSNILLKNRRKRQNRYP